MTWKNLTFPSNSTSTPSSALCLSCGQGSGAHLFSGPDAFEECAELPVSPAQAPKPPAPPPAPRSFKKTLPPPARAERSYSRSENGTEWWNR